MNMHIQNASSGGGEFVLLVSFLIAIATSIFWMVVGWRAMRAHERIAAVGEDWLISRREERVAIVRDSQQRPNDPSTSSEDHFTPHKDAPPEYPWTKEL